MYVSHKISFWDKKEAKRLFQELLFYVLIKKQRIKGLQKLPFYGELNIKRYRKHLKDIQEVIGLK